MRAEAANEIYTPDAVLRSIVQEDSYPESKPKVRDLQVGQGYRFKRERIRNEDGSKSLTSGGWGRYVSIDPENSQRVLLERNKELFSINHAFLFNTLPFYKKCWRDAFLRTRPNIADPVVRTAIGQTRPGLLLTQKELPYLQQAEAVFQNYLELWVALLFEYHEIRYYSEQPVKTSDNGVRVPDFYLPDLDHYIEVTVSPRSEKMDMLRDIQWIVPARKFSTLHRNIFIQLFSEIDYLSRSWSVADYLKEYNEQTRLNSSYEKWSGEKEASYTLYQFENWQPEK